MVKLKKGHLPHRAAAKSLSDEGTIWQRLDDIAEPGVSVKKKRRQTSEVVGQPVTEERNSLEEQKRTSEAEGSLGKVDTILQKRKRKLTKTDDAADDDEEVKEDRRGIVHLANVPSGMQPEKLRHYMGQFGDVGRVFLQPEDKTFHNSRKKTGGNRKMRYTEGWIEFEERKIARRVAMTLNSTPIGGKKRHNFFRDDMWNIRYLPKFKWHQLKEAQIYNQQVRKARLEQKVGQARRENEFFLEKVEQAKVKKRIEQKYEQKGRSPKAASKRPDVQNSGTSASSLPNSGKISEKVLSLLF